MEGPGPALAIILGSILLGVTFAAVDAALAELGEVRLRALAAGGGSHARAAARAVRDLDRIRARLLAGRVISLSAAVALSSRLAAMWGTGGVLLAAAAVALVYSGLAEIATTAARRRAGRWAVRMLQWLRPFEWLAEPVAIPLAWLGRIVTRWVPEAPVDDAERVAEIGLEQMIDESQQEGAIEPHHADLLRSVLEFKNTVAHEVMVPRTQMVAIETGTPLPQVLELIIEKGHSRYPVYRDRIDDVVGVLYAKDLFAIARDGEEVDGKVLGDVIRKSVFFAAESQKIGTLLNEMQARRVHLAVVVDEFGGTSGIVTLEDIIEEIVGDIRDEYDGEDSTVVEVGPGHYLADARISVYDLEEHIGAKIHDEEGDYDSLGGMLVELAGHVPAVGESLLAGPFRLTVREADQRHVRRVEIRRQKDDAAAV